MALELTLGLEVSAARAGIRARVSVKVRVILRMALGLVNASCTSTADNLGLALNLARTLAV